MIISGYSVSSVRESGIDLEEDLVDVEEKIDGSQYSFGKIDGELKCRNRSRQLDLEKMDRQFDAAIQTSKELEPKLHDNWIYRGEFLSRPKHNRQPYERVPKKNIVIFDIVANDRILSRKELETECERLGLEPVQCMIRNAKVNLKDLEKFVETPSVKSMLGGSIEGVVIKRRTDKPSRMKIVSESFKEVSNKKDKGPKESIRKYIGQRYNTKARWKKAIQHLKEDGKLPEGNAAIGPIVNEIHQDVLRECRKEIEQMLFEWAWKEIKKEIVSGFPKWWQDGAKDELAE